MSTAAGLKPLNFNTMMLNLDTFSEAFNFTLDHEGRIVEDVDGDPGGKTKWGVTQVDYNNYRRENKQSTRDVALATEDEIGALYARHYWYPMHASYLPGPIGAILFDCAVNMGVGASIRLLQGVLCVPQDGVWGKYTSDALWRYIDLHGAEPLAAGLLDRREARYHSLVESNPVLAKFLNGWLNRVNDLRRDVGLIAA